MSTNIPPVSGTKKMDAAYFLPIDNLTIWGITNPTKAILPTIATLSPVNITTQTL